MEQKHSVVMTGKYFTLSTYCLVAHIPKAQAVCSSEMSHIKYRAKLAIHKIKSSIDNCRLVTLSNSCASVSMAPKLAQTCPREKCLKSMSIIANSGICVCKVSC